MFLDVFPFLYLCKEKAMPAGQMRKRDPRHGDGNPLSEKFDYYQFAIYDEKDLLEITFDP